MLGNTWLLTFTGSWAARKLFVNGLFFREEMEVIKPLLLGCLAICRFWTAAIRSRSRLTAGTFFCGSLRLWTSARAAGLESLAMLTRDSMRPYETLCGLAVFIIRILSAFLPWGAVSREFLAPVLAVILCSVFLVVFNLALSLVARLPRLVLSSVSWLDKNPGSCGPGNAPDVLTECPGFARRFLATFPSVAFVISFENGLC